jgi:hypothetical protein
MPTTDKSSNAAGGTGTPSADSETIRYAFVGSDGQPCAQPNTPGGPKLTFAETTYLMMSHTHQPDIVCWGAHGGADDNTILVRNVL